MKNTKGSFKELFVTVGAILAYLIGASYATGQETMLYFGSFGLEGLIGLAIAMVLFCTICATIMIDFKKKPAEKPTDIFARYVGKHLAIPLTIAIPITVYIFYITMLSGAGTTLEEYYGLAPAIGRVFMGILCMIVVYFGLNNIVNIIGRIGPLIIAFILLISIVSCFVKGDMSIAQGSAYFLSSSEVSHAAPYFWWAPVLYCSSLTLTGICFYAGLGPKLSSAKNCLISGVIAGGIYIGVGFFLCIAYMKNAPSLLNVGVPLLALASKTVPALATIFSIFLIAGIFTTATPMLYIPVNTLAEDGTKKAKILTIILGIAGIIISFLPYQLLLQILAPISGYIGIFIMIGLFWSLLYRRIKQ